MVFDENGVDFDAILAVHDLHPHLRPMNFDDLDQLVEIEKLLFSCPWPRDAFECELEQSCSELYVVEIDGRIAAYIFLRLLLDEMHVLNIAVIPEYQHKGIARKMLELFIEKSQIQQQVQLVHLEVRESNLRAIRLYEKIGFKTVGRRRNYYTDPKEDALLMTYFIN